MKKMLATLALLLTFGLSFSAVAAQDGVEAPDVDGMEMEVEGAEYAYGRTYSVDFEALMSTPDVDMASLDTSAMMRSISIQGVQFDSEDNANKYIEDSKASIDEAMNGDEALEGMEDLTVSELEGFDKDGLLVTMGMPDLEAGMVMIVFVDGDQVYQITSIDGSVEDAQTKAEEVTQYVIDAEIENEEVTFNADGTSTGGVFDRMPAAGDEIVGDLTGVMDMEVLAPGAE